MCDYCMSNGCCFTQMLCERAKAEDFSAWSSAQRTLSYGSLVFKKITPFHPFSTEIDDYIQGGEFITIGADIF